MPGPQEHHEALMLRVVSLGLLLFLAYSTWFSVQGLRGTIPREKALGQVGRFFNLFGFDTNPEVWDMVSNNYYRLLISHYIFFSLNCLIFMFRPPELHTSILAVGLGYGTGRWYIILNTIIKGVRLRQKPCRNETRS